MKIKTILDIQEKSKFGTVHYVTYAIIADDKGNLLDAYGWGKFEVGQRVEIWFDESHNKIKFKKFKAKYLT